MKKKISFILLLVTIVSLLCVPQYADAKSKAERNTEIANVPVEIMLDVSEDEPTWYQLSSDVLVIHAHSEQEGEFLAKIFEIPQYIYDEMNELDWAKKEQREYIMKMHSHQVDISFAWDMSLEGKTEVEIIELYSECNETREKLLNQYIDGEITIDEYVERYPFSTDSLSVTEIRKSAEEAKDMMYKRLIENSGLTQDDIDYCKKEGITNIREMAEAKSFAALNKIKISLAITIRKDSKDWQEVSEKLSDEKYLSENGIVLETPITEKYADVPKDLWGFKYISQLSNDGIISGYNDGKFRPYGYVTRAELAKLLSTSFEVSKQTTISFDDIETHWAKEYIENVSVAIPMRNEDAFLPDEAATREECISSIAKLMNLSGGISNKMTFNDEKSINPELIEYVKLATNAGIVNGYEDGSFKPKNNVTRMEIAVMLYRALYEYIK